jgi:AcrR family transcriptional regulator
METNRSTGAGVANPPRSGKRSATGSARERLLAAADELFYETGIHSIGIDKVIERAGVAKASLYDVFGSKDELIRSYLELRAQTRRARLETRLARHTAPRERLSAVFDVVAESMAEPRYRGCAFTRANAEAAPTGPVKKICDDYRTWLRDLFATIVRDAGGARADAVARQILMLYDGAAVAAQLDGDVGAARTARAAALMMLDAAVAAKRASA